MMPFAAPLFQQGTSYLLNKIVKGFQLSPYGNVAYYWNVKMKQYKKLGIEPSFFDEQKYNIN